MLMIWAWADAAKMFSLRLIVLVGTAYLACSKKPPLWMPCRWCDVRAVYFRNQTVGFAVVHLSCRSIGHFQIVFAATEKGKTKMTKKQTTDKINQPEFAPEEWRKAAIMYDTSFAWCKNQISAWGKNQISFTPGFNEMFDEALDTLPERNRDIVQKYFRDRMTFSQIADLHGTSRSIVRHLCIWTVWRVMNLILLREGSNQNAAPQTGGGTEGGY